MVTSRNFPVHQLGVSQGALIEAVGEALALELKAHDARQTGFTGMSFFVTFWVLTSSMGRF